MNYMQTWVALVHNIQTWAAVIHDTAWAAAMNKTHDTSSEATSIGTNPGWSANKQPWNV